MAKRAAGNKSSTNTSGRPRSARSRGGPPTTVARMDAARYAAMPAEERGGVLAAHVDGWRNILSAHGTSRDRRTATTFAPSVITDLEAIQLWRGDDMAARIIEIFPREAMRQSFEVKTDDKEVGEAVHAAGEELDLDEKVKLAGQYERAYGGAAIYPVMEGATGDLATPLNEGSISRVTALHVLEPRQLQPTRWIRDINDPAFNMPETYRLIPLSAGGGGSPMIEIHRSRLVIWPGKRVTAQLQAGQRPGWGDNALTPAYDVLRDFEMAWASSAYLLTDFATGVLQMDGLADLMAQEGGDEKVQKRLALIQMMRSTIRDAIIDGKDKYSRQTTPVSGLDSLLEKWEQRLAAAADMPVTILMGMSPAGMSATGESDIRGFYDRVAGVQAYYRHRIERLLKLLMLSTSGPTDGNEPDQWSIEFPSLWQPSEKEQAEARNLQAQTDKIYAVDIGNVKGSTIARARFGGDTYSFSTPMTPEELDELEKAEEAPTPQDLALLQGTTPPGVTPPGTPAPDDGSGNGQPGTVPPTDEPVAGTAPARARAVAAPRPKK